jgi:hypothetical protein
MVNKYPMTSWRELCIRAAFEDNPERLSETVAEIDRELPARQEQLTDEIFERLGSRAPTSRGPGKWLQ